MNKLPFNPTVRHHAYSTDPGRDRAVRLAEDGVTRRKTLEECIAVVWMIPKTGSASSAPEQENKVESMSGIFHVDFDNTITDEEHVDGTRTERVVVEIQHSGAEPINLDDLALHLRTRLGQFVRLRLTPESVRVVHDAENAKAAVEAGDSWRRTAEKLQEEINAATVHLPACCGSLADAADTLEQERDALAARVETLEIALKQAALEIAAHAAAPAAEPVAWEYPIPTEHGMGRGVTLMPPTKLGWREIHGVDPASCVPLFIAPPQPRGWLTEEEREQVRFDMNRHIRECVGCIERETKDEEGAKSHSRSAEVLERLLARNAPPRVKMPPAIHKDILAALAAAGVEVESQS